MKRAGLLLSTIFVFSGCQVQSGFGPGTSQPAPPPPGAEQPAPEAGGAATGGAGGAVVASADCPNPANHCLDDSDVFVADREWNGGWNYVEVGTQQGAADGAGEASFFLKRQGKDRTSKWFYKTRPATAQDVQVGKLVIMFHKASNGIYQAPESRPEAYKQPWWMARIVNTNPIAVGNYVIVSSGYLVGVGNLRVIEGDDSPTVAVNSAEDGHFFSPDHWIISDQPLRDSSWQYVHPAAAIQAPSPDTRNEGHFVNLNNGKMGWTGHAWATRPAAQADLKAGKRVFMLHRNQNGAYQKPGDRLDAFKTPWWTARITDTSGAYKGVVTVSGGYQVAVDALRVAL